MNFEMISNVDEIPARKKHTVPRGEYMKILQTLLDSDQPALVIHCDSVDDAIKRTVGFYNTANNKGIDVKVSRRDADVYIEKEDIE